MEPTQTLARSAYPHLPSGSHVSFSEISTFQNCPRQHYWRYYVRLATKRYSELRNMVMGSVVHDATDKVYRNPGKDPYDLLREVVDKARAEFVTASFAPFFDSGQFETDILVAEHMFRVWIEHVYAAEQASGIEILESESRFELEIAGQLFVGVIDRIYEVTKGDHPGIYVGELKTRGYSFRTGLKTVVKKDLQTKVYLAALRAKGYEPEGVVYTVVKKPHMNLMVAMTGDDHEDIATRAAIDIHYETPKFGDHYKREAIPVVFDEQALHAELTASLSAMNTFYLDPDEGVRSAPILPSNRFPCMFCEFSPICHERKTIDGSFRYKRKRSS